MMARHYAEISLRHNTIDNPGVDGSIFLGGLFGEWLFAGGVVYGSIFPFS